MRIDYTGPNPQKPHILHVGLRYEAVPDGEDKINEVLCRKSVYEALATDGEKLAYAQTCELWHFGRDATVRAAWDADDQAQADAAVAAAQAIEYAKLVVTPAGFVTGENGAITGVQVTITHQGYACSAVIDADPATAEANALVAWTASKAAVDAQAALLAAFAIG